MLNWLLLLLCMLKRLLFLNQATFEWYYFPYEIGDNYFFLMKKGTFEERSPNLHYEKGDL